MQFHPLNPSSRFTVGDETWHAGVYSAMPNGVNAYFAAVVREGNNRQIFALRPAEYEGALLTNVTLFSEPKQEEFALNTLPTPICEQLASALEVAVRQEGKAVDPELLEAIQKGGDLKAEREAGQETKRLSRNADYDLEAAYILRDALREEINTALDEGRDDDARLAMEQLGAVKKDIAGYWNPHKPRPAVAQPLGEKEEALVREVEEMPMGDLMREAANEALAHFGKEAADALSRGDTEAHDAAIDKVRQYSEVHESLDKTAEEEIGAQVRKLGKGRQLNDGGHSERILEERRGQAQREIQGDFPGF